MMVPPVTPARARILALGLLVLAFVAGALGGIAADRLLGSRQAEAAPPAPRGGRPGGPGAGAVFPLGAALARQLELTPQQREQIAEILAADRQKADSILRAVRPVLQARYDSTTDAVRAVLTPEQRERFENLRDSRRERMRRRGAREGRGSG